MTTRADTMSLPRHDPRQRGAALIVSLVLLLVMTILGVTAMNSSILQAFMSSSYQQQTVTLATAENILRAGELRVEELVTVGFGPDPLAYYRNLVTDPGTQFPAATFSTTWPANQYVIEYLGRRIVPGESVAIGGGLSDSLIHLFRVSARELRPVDERSSLRIVQSLYVTLDAPEE
jgi:type IV pilus assembly protein PilX